MTSMAAVELITSAITAATRAPTAGALGHHQTNSHAANQLKGRPWSYAESAGEAKEPNATWR
jgi:hypothetical protein